jgi:hypothetical protein
VLHTNAARDESCDALGDDGGGSVGGVVEQLDVERARVFERGHGIEQARGDERFVVERKLDGERRVMRRGEPRGLRRAPPQSDKMETMEAVDREHAENDVVQRQDGVFGGRHAAALILLAAAVAVAPWVSRPAFVALYTVATAAWLIMRGASLRLRYVLAIAVLLRLMMLLPAMTLSGDVYRYLWDGKVLAGGTNPYAYAPSDPRLASLREPWHPRINHPEIRTIYPPHAELLFALVHWLTPWRILIALADLAAIVLLRRHGLAYATFPLLLFEGTWSGHVDALAAVLVAVAMLRDSGVAAGLAAGLKVIPLAGVPALLVRSRQRVRLALGFAVALVVPVLAFVRGPIMPGLHEYATRWIFNSPAYDTVFATISRLPLKELWTASSLRTPALSDVVYRHLYPDFVTRVVLGALAMLAVLLARRSVTRGLALFLLLTPTIHPWYWLVTVPPALIERSAWIAFALCAPFSYLLYDGAPKVAVYALCYGLPAVAIVIHGRRVTRFRL